METATSETINQPLVNGQIDERHTSDTVAADSLSHPSSGIKDTVSGPVQQLHSPSGSGHFDYQTPSAAQRTDSHPPEFYRRGPPRPPLSVTGRQESQPVLSPAGAPLQRSPVQPQSSTLQPHGPNIRPPPLLRRVESSGFLPAPPQPRQNNPLNFQPQNWPRPPTRPQNPGQYRPVLERPEDQTNTAYIHENTTHFVPNPNPNPVGVVKPTENTDLKKTVTFSTTPTDGQPPTALQNFRQPPPGIIRRPSPWALLKEKLPAEGRGRLLLNQGVRPNIDFLRMQSPDQGNLQKREGNTSALNMTAGRGSSPAPGANPQTQSPPIYNGRPFSGNMAGKPGMMQRPPSQEGNSPSPHPGVQRVMSGERKSPAPDMQRTDSMRQIDPRGTPSPQERTYSPNTNSPKPPLGPAKSPKPSLDDDDDVVMTTGDARMTMGRGTPPMRPQSGNRPISGDSMDLSRTYTKMQFDSSRPPSGQDANRPSLNMDNSRPPSSHEFKRPTSSHDINRPQTSLDNSRPPTGHDTNRPPSGHDISRPQTSHDNSRPPSGHDTNRPPSAYDNSRPTIGQDISRPPTSHDSSRPSTGHEISRPPTSHDNISRPPTGHDNISRPPTGHDNISRPPTGHETSRPQSGLVRTESRQSIDNRILSGADSRNEMRPTSRPLSGDSHKSPVPNKAESQHSPSPALSQKSDSQDNKSQKDSRAQSRGSLSPQGSVEKLKTEQSRTPTPNPPASVKLSQPDTDENQPESEKSTPKVSAQPSPEPRKSPDIQKTPEPQRTPEPQKVSELQKSPEPSKTPEPPKSPEKQGVPDVKKSPELRKSPDRPGSKHDSSLSASNYNSVVNTPTPNKSAEHSRASTPYPAKSSESSANPTPSTKSAADSRNVTPSPAQISSNDSGTATPGKAGEQSLPNSRGQTPDRSETPIKRKTPAERPKSLKRSLSGKVTPDTSFDHNGKVNTSGSSSRISSAGRRSESKSPLQRSASARRSKSGSKTPDGDHDSGVDETTQGHEAPTTNGDLGSPNKSPSKIPAPKKLSMPSPTKSTTGSPKTPEGPPSTGDKKKVPMNKVQVGTAQPPNLKTVRSKIGSLENTSHRPGGGHVKIENRKVDFSHAQPRIAAKNETYTPGGGDKKITKVKLQWTAKSKVGSLENASHKPGGGDKKIESMKLDFKDKAKPKIGSTDNIKHKPGGGTVKNTGGSQEGNPGDIEDQKLDIKAQSKIGSFENVKHKPGGGDKKIFDDKEYLKQIGSVARKASSEHLASGSQGEDGYCSSSSTSRKTSRDRRQPSETRIERQRTPTDPKISPRDEKKHIKDQHRSLKEKHIDKTQKSASQKATTKEKEKKNTDNEQVDLSTENVNDVQASPDEQAADSTKSPTEDGEEMDLNSNQTSSEGHSEDLDKPVVKDKKTISETDSNVKHHDVNGMDVEKPSDKSENEVISTEKDIKESVNKESKVTEKLKTDEQIEEHLEKEQSEKIVQSKNLEKSVEDDKIVQIEKETTERMEKDTTKIQQLDKPKNEKCEPTKETILIKSEPKTEANSFENANDLKNKTDDKGQHKVTTISNTDCKLKESNNKIQISNTGLTEVHPSVIEISHSSEVQTSQKKESVGKDSLADSDVIKKDSPESTASEKSSSKMETVTNNVETKEDLSLKATEYVEKTDKGKTDPLVLEQKEKYTSLPASEGKTRTDSTNLQNADTDVTRKPNEIKQEDKSKLPGTHFDTNIIKTLEVSTTENQTSKMSQNSKESKLGETDIITNTESKEVPVGVSKLVGDSRSPVVSEETKPDQSLKSNISSGTSGIGSTVKEGIIMPQPDK